MDTVDVPISIYIQPVEPKHGWNVTILDFPVRRILLWKSVYYYEATDMPSQFQNVHSKRLTDDMLSSMTYVGEYKPMYQFQKDLIRFDFHDIPYVLHEFTDIVYILPDKSTISFKQHVRPALRKTIRHNMERYFYGGMFSPYLHAMNHTNELFLQVHKATMIRRQRKLKREKNEYIVMTDMDANVEQGYDFINDSQNTSLRLPTMEEIDETVREEEEYEYITMSSEKTVDEIIGIQTTTDVIKEKRIETNDILLQNPAYFIKEIESVHWKDVPETYDFVFDASKPMELEKQVIQKKELNGEEYDVLW